MLESSHPESFVHHSAFLTDPRFTSRTTVPRLTSIPNHMITSLAPFTTPPVHYRPLRDSSLSSRSMPLQSRSHPPTFTPTADSPFFHDTSICDTQRQVK